MPARPGSTSASRDTVKIDSILVDPNDPNLVIVSALGDATHDGGGIYRSTDGGKTWTNVLKPAGYDGTREVRVRIRRPQRHAGRHAGHGRRFRRRRRTRRSTSTSRRRFSSPPTKARRGPRSRFRRFRAASAWRSRCTPSGQRMYIVGNNIESGSGLYRSDDGGAPGSTWQARTRASATARAHIAAASSWIRRNSRHPLHREHRACTVPRTAALRSRPSRARPAARTTTSSGSIPLTATAWWSAPTRAQPSRLDGGNTWSLWYTQPIGQVYHVTTDSQYPYWIMASQQDTGAVMIAAAATGARSTSPTGARCPLLNSASSRPIPRIPTSLCASATDPAAAATD